MTKAIKCIKNQCGELLIESILSVILFTIMLLSVAQLLSVSSNLNQQSLKAGKTQQLDYNQAVSPSTMGTNANFAISGVNGGQNINVIVKTKIYSQSAFFAFRP